eukprot:CAMPEP_0198277006 /NCGR_PEP_ID=MMETSP1447-20131203/65610_1 /TAXON_ID=420782 /ORGANISM="Chaetoceros dichaeta, Strain CCMP1751" /LENGTH=300 /DNA_ID=CAMNT_0043971995 /DNA_START=2805 /DNA_END=3704 /DNA_ORIENTATION=-
MSEFTKTGQKISSRHHSSTTSRQVEETRVPDPTYKSSSAAKNQHEHQQMLNTTPGATTPTDQQSLPFDNESPFASDQTPISHSTSNTTTPPHTSNQRQRDIESGGVADTSGQPRDGSLDETTLLTDRISALEQQLRYERSNVTNLASTLSQERLTFEERMLRMEQTVARISAAPPHPLPSTTTTITQAQIDMIAKNRAAAIKLRAKKANNPLARPAIPNPSTTSASTTAPATTPDPSRHSQPATSKNIRANTPDPSRQPKSAPPAQKSRIAENRASTVSILAPRTSASLTQQQMPTSTTI